MTGRRLVIVGTGDHARVMIEAARAAGRDVAGVIDPSPASDASSTDVDGVPVIGRLYDESSWARVSQLSFVVAVGRNDVRMRLFRDCVARGWVPAPLVHPSATILAGARIEPGAQVCAGAVIGVAATVGPNVIVNTAAIIDHDNHISQHATVGPGARLAGRVRVGEGAFVGIGAIVREGITIGDWALVAAGAVVIRHVGSSDRVAGVPARAMSNPERERGVRDR